MQPDLTNSFIGYFSLLLFALSYIAIALEDKIGVNKSKPALFVGTFLFFIIGIYFLAHDGHVPANLQTSVEHVILEISEIFFFLYVAMTYIEALLERGVFDVMKSRLMQKQLTYKKLLWTTGILTFFISAIADNLTTALVFATLLITIEKENKAFLVPAAINVVVASNAGGAWSPFGDITTLMIWNAGKAPFFDFFYLFPASFIGWLVTCYLLSLFVPSSTPDASDEKESVMKEGAMGIVWLGFLTIAISVFAHQALHLPAIVGMMFGLSLLMAYSYNLKRKKNVDIGVFKSISKVENDTLLFFFGLMFAVGALSYIGYLALVADVYKTVNPTLVNIGIGFLSAIVDNVPLTYAVLKANPAISVDQWLLVALAAGCGGSMIAFGSAAGVGVMGKMRGVYTFASHMKYAWTVVVGFLVSVGVWYVQFEMLGFY
jgi:Na+/H+ antiporter NhaD/arsenite permease-like protein